MCVWPLNLWALCDITATFVLLPEKSGSSLVFALQEELNKVQTQHQPCTQAHTQTPPSYFAVTAEVWGSPAEGRVGPGQKVQRSERLREEAGAGRRSGTKPPGPIALSDSTPALDGFFSTSSPPSLHPFHLLFTQPLRRTGCAFGVKPSRKC